MMRRERSLQRASCGCSETWECPVEGTMVNDWREELVRRDGKWWGWMGRDGQDGEGHCPIDEFRPSLSWKQRDITERFLSRRVTWAGLGLRRLLRWAAWKKAGLGMEDWLAGSFNDRGNNQWRFWICHWRQGQRGAYMRTREEQGAFGEESCMVVCLQGCPGFLVWQVGRWRNHSSIKEILKGDPNSIHSFVPPPNALMNSLWLLAFIKHSAWILLFPR